MAFVVYLTGVKPGARDDQPWTGARVEESADPAPEEGAAVWTEVQTFVLSPVDADPEDPAARNFTVTEATIETGGWYRVVFTDADDGEQVAGPYQYGSSTDLESGPVLEALRDLLAFRLHTGTFSTPTISTGTVANFTADTRPTLDQATRMAGLMADAVARDFPRAAPADADSLTEIASLRGAIRLEGALYPDQVESQRSPARLWLDMLESLTEDLLDRLGPIGRGSTGDDEIPVDPETGLPVGPVWSFDDGCWRAIGSECEIPPIPCCPPRSLRW